LSEPAEPTDGSAASRRRRRPVAVTLVGLLALGTGAYDLVTGAVILHHGGDASRAAAAVVDLALGVLALAIGRGALRMASWAWAAFMTWAVVGLTHELLRHFFYSDANYLSLAIDTAVVLVLTPLDIQVAFGVRRRPALSLEGTSDGAIG
jgi:hypothetical protein